MPVDPEKLKSLIERELANVRDDRVVQHVQSLLIEPRPEFRDWDYGAPNQQYLCWVVLDHHSGTSIAYCEEGFGPRSPWGLISSDWRHGTMGMDSAWYPIFMEAYFESFASADLPIWRVFSMDTGWPGNPLTGELSWDAAWQQCEASKRENPGPRFGVHHMIVYGG
jgi:hypothetical protein